MIKVALCYLGLFYQFNANAWFILPYIGFVVILPFITLLTAKIKSKPFQLLLDLFLVIVPLTISMISFRLVGEIGYIYNTLMYTVLFILPFFYTGSMFAKYDVFAHIRCFKTSILNLLLGLLLLVVSFFLRKFWDCWVYGMNATDLIIAPILITSILFIFKGIKFVWISKIFIHLGKMSSNIWLIHYVFCQGSLLLLATYCKYAVLAFAVVMLLCAVSSYVIDFTYERIRRKVKFL